MYDITTLRSIITDLKPSWTSSPLMTAKHTVYWRFVSKKIYLMGLKCLLLVGIEKIKNKQKD